MAKEHRWPKREKLGDSWEQWQWWRPRVPRRLGLLSPSYLRSPSLLTLFLSCFCSSLRISLKARHITEFIGLFKGDFPCTARLASNVQSSCLILPNAGMRGVGHHAYFCMAGLKWTRTLNVTECIEWHHSEQWGWNAERRLQEPGPALNSINKSQYL